MNIFTFFFIAALAPPYLAARWGLMKLGVKDPEDWQIQFAIGGLAILVCWTIGLVQLGTEALS